MRRAWLWSALAATLICLDAPRLRAEGQNSAADSPILTSSRRTARLEVNFTRTAWQPGGATADAGAEEDVRNRLKPIGEVGLAISSPDEKLPPDYAARFFKPAGVDLQYPGESRPWGMSVYRWEATALCHRPLYFQEVNLERYGNSLGVLQPAVSAIDFCGRVLAMPYLWGAMPPRECVYVLGQGRPGDYMPYYLHRPPISARGLMLETCAVLGLVYVVP